jgi:UDP-3-O-[3-hydroxymyristoyl] glucosamine N-acyltransferase
MPDPRFFITREPITLAAAAERIGGRIVRGDPGQLIADAATLARATASSVAFAADEKWKAQLAATQAGVVLVPPRLVEGAPSHCAVLESAWPQASWAMLAACLHPPRPFAGDVAMVDPSAELEEGVSIAIGAIVGPGARIGRGSSVGPGAIIGAGVSIGRDCRIGPRAVIGFALIGDRVTISAGAVVGEAGFGAAGGPSGVVDVPQLGRVILQDGVSLGAQTCVDRGAFEDTVVGENTKVDNLVHIAHNCRIGRNCVMAAFTGIAGSVEVGDGVAFGGRAGIADHVVIGGGASIAGGAGVIGNVPAGETWAGYPARPIRQWLRESATVARMTRRKGQKNE